MTMDKPLCPFFKKPCIQTGCEFFRCDVTLMDRAHNTIGYEGACLLKSPSPYVPKRGNRWSSDENS